MTTNKEKLTKPHQDTAPTPPQDLSRIWRGRKHDFGKGCRERLLSDFVHPLQAPRSWRVRRGKKTCVTFLKTLLSLIVFWPNTCLVDLTLLSQDLDLV